MKKDLLTIKKPITMNRFLSILERNTRFELATFTLAR